MRRSRRGEELETRQARSASAESTKKTVQDIPLFLGEMQSLGCEPLRKGQSAKNRMNQEKGQTTMNEVVKFPINTPVEVTLQSEAGKRVEGRYGGQVMYSLLGDRVMYVPPYVEQRFQDLAIGAGEPLLLCKREVKVGDRNRIEWSVRRAPQQPLASPNGTAAADFDTPPNLQPAGPRKEKEMEARNGEGSLGEHQTVARVPDEAR
jgi:hypothetical protein